MHFGLSHIPSQVIKSHINQRQQHSFWNKPASQHLKKYLITDPKTVLDTRCCISVFVTFIQDSKPKNHNRTALLLNNFPPNDSVRLPQCLKDQPSFYRELCNSCGLGFCTNTELQPQGFFVSNIKLLQKSGNSRTQSIISISASLDYFQSRSLTVSYFQHFQKT